jgi:hypothetical protein
MSRQRPQPEQCHESGDNVADNHDVEHGNESACSQHHSGCDSIGLPATELVRGPSQKLFVSLKDFRPQLSGWLLRACRLRLMSRHDFLFDRALNLRSDGGACHKISPFNRLYDFLLSRALLYIRGYRPTPAGCFSSFVSLAMGACTNAAVSAIPSATRTSFAILLRTSGRRTNKEKIAATPHNTAEM